MAETADQSAATGGWKTARFLLEWPTWSLTGRRRPLLMGILNVTPDSFSDGGLYANTEAALRHARQLLDEGADILDVGAESTRPGARGIDADTEWQRLAPILSELVKWGVPLSLDTMKPAVMQRGLEVGVDILNDVSGFTQSAACKALAGSDAAAVVMHMQGEPRTMQQSPHYTDCVTEVRHFLGQRLQHLQMAGVAANRVLVDPGFGFGKTLEHNRALFAAICDFAAMGAGVLVGVSRKSMIGQLTGQADAMQRVHGSVGAAACAAVQGARVLRVHDVRATRDALLVMDALRA